MTRSSDLRPMCMPMASADEDLRDTSCARRPDRVVALVSTRPLSSSCLTILDTVAGDRPVTLASSTCVMRPYAFTASTIRALLASRSDC